MKKILALLLCAVMYLSFVACGGGSCTTETTSGSENASNDGNNQSGDNNGNNLGKIERGTVTTSENPLLQVLFQTLADEGWSYTFNEDGTCGDQVYWWIEEDTEDRIIVYICTDYEWKYQLYASPFNDQVRVSYNIACYMYGEFLAWQPGLFYDVDYPNT